MRFSVFRGMCVQRTSLCAAHTKTLYTWGVFHACLVAVRCVLSAAPIVQAAKELLPGSREGGAAVNAVGQMAVLTLKGASALNR